MKVIYFILIAICITTSIQGQLLKPKQQKKTLKQSFFENFLYATAPLNITTQCNTIDLKEYNGLTLSGYLNVGIENSNSALGFIFFGAKGVQPSELKYRPTIFWLNGGPGCSSQFGNFYELGPLKIIENDGIFNFTENINSWSNEYNNIFIDQPIGTGISYAQQFSEIPIDQTEVASQFYNALIELYENKNGCFNELGINGQDTPIFIYGESYAGKYIPSISQKIVQEGNKFNLRGIGIGDGFTSPYLDLQAINQYSLDQGMITLEQFERTQVNVKSAQKAINESNWDQASSLFGAIVSASNPNNVDVYNILRKQEQDTSALDNFFNSKFGQNLFHVQLSKQFSQCDSQVYSALSTDFIKGDCVEKVNYLLEQGIHVHVFNGDLDLIVPYYAPQLWINTLNWTHIESFKDAETKTWRDGSSVYGTIKQFENLTFTIVFNSGHMVPQDQPEASLSLIKNAVEYSLSNSSKVHTSSI